MNNLLLRCWIETWLVRLFNWNVTEIDGPRKLDISSIGQCPKARVAAYVRFTNDSAPQHYVKRLLFLQKGKKKRHVKWLLPFPWNRAGTQLSPPLYNLRTRSRERARKRWKRRRPNRSLGLQPSAAPSAKLPSTAASFAVVGWFSSLSFVSSFFFFFFLFFLSRTDSEFFCSGTKPSSSAMSLFVGCR